MSAEHKFDYNQTWTDNDMQTDRMSVQSRLFSMCLQVNVMLKKKGKTIFYVVCFCFFVSFKFQACLLVSFNAKVPFVWFLETASKDFLHPLSIGMKFLKRILTAVFQLIYC